MSGELHGMSTLSEARAWLRERVDEGATCPTCHQHARIWKRTVTSSHARALIAAYRMHGLMTPFKMSDVEDAAHICRGDAAKLALWGLVQEENRQRDDGGRAGWWVITPKGERFVLGHDLIEKYAHVYDGRVLRFSGALVSIHDSLGTAFRYDDLLAGV